MDSGPFSKNSHINIKKKSFSGEVKTAYFFLFIFVAAPRDSLSDRGGKILAPALDSDQKVNIQKTLFGNQLSACFSFLN